MFHKDEPLWLPKGSVRAVIALAVITFYVLGVMPAEAMFLVVGFYFGSRATKKDDDGPSA